MSAVLAVCDHPSPRLQTASPSRPTPSAGGWAMPWRLFGTGCSGGLELSVWRPAPALDYLPKTPNPKNEIGKNRNGAIQRGRICYTVADVAYSTQVNARYPEILLARIDAAAGAGKRTEWILEACRMRLDAGVAQKVEHRATDPEAGGSIPPPRSKPDMAA